MSQSCGNGTTIQAFRLCFSPSTLKALDKIAQGVPIEDRCHRNNQWSIMKIAPIGLISDYHDLPTLKMSWKSARQPTTPKSPLPAQIVAAAISYTVRGDNPSKKSGQWPLITINAAKEYGHADFQQLLTFRT